MRYAAALGLVLACIFGSSAARADVIPPGSYQQSCFDFYADGTVLSATCRTPWGGENYTTLRDYQDCDGDIANRYGRLQCVEDDRGDDDGAALPRGSYRQSCRNAEIRRDTLTAECRDRDGRWRYSELQSYRSCTGDIANWNGMLACRRGGDDGGSGDLPSGSWHYSCRDARVYGNILYAQCRDDRGAWHDTSINFAQCGGEVVNYGGRLACGGVSRGRITLYRHAYFIGTAHSFTSDVPDLNAYDFGNVASSVTVEGSLWELCDKPYYRGRCVVVSRTQTNLRAYGFTDRAESVRRLH